MHYTISLILSSQGLRRYLAFFFFGRKKKARITLRTFPFFCRHNQGNKEIQGFYIKGIKAIRAWGSFFFSCCCSKSGNILVFASRKNQHFKHIFWHGKTGGTQFCLSQQKILVAHALMGYFVAHALNLGVINDKGKGKFLCLLLLIVGQGSCISLEEKSMFEAFFLAHALMDR